MKFSKLSSASSRRASRLPSGALLIGTLALLASCGAGGDGTREGSVRSADGAPAAQQEPHEAAEPEPVSPLFTFSAEELAGLVADAPAAVREAVEAGPRRFLDLVGSALMLPWDQRVLVDKRHSIGEYSPPELVALDDLDDRLVLSRRGHRLTPVATNALLDMSAAASAEGVTLVISSTYRSWERQRELFDYWVQELGEEEASRVSARAGTSQHQLGTTVDFGCICPEFATQEAGIWLARNAWRFGFSLSYPDGYEEITGYSYEPWHFRYIGTGASELEREFFGGIQQWMLEFLHENREALEDAYLHS